METFWKEYHRRASEFERQISNHEKGKFGYFTVYGFLNGKAMPDYDNMLAKTNNNDPEITHDLAMRHGKCVICVQI